jgi:hypothetical protein
MRLSTPVLLLILLVSFSCLAQQSLSPTVNVPNSGITSSGPASKSREQVEHLRRARSALADYLATLTPGSEDFQKTKATIEELDVRLRNLATGAGEDSVSTNAVAGPAAVSNPPSVTPEFSLATPANGRTNLSTEPALTWTEDRRHGAFQDPPLYNLKKFHVVVATDQDFHTVAFEKDVPPASAKVTPSAAKPKGVQSIATTVAVEDGNLVPGTKYYWQVFAVYTPQGQPDTVEFQQKAETRDGRPDFFITAIDPFAPLTKRHFTLQRTVNSKDLTEGAQFSFLKDFRGKTVFSTDFAFFWDSPTHKFADKKGFLWFRPAVEGRLTSDDSTAEDAWRFSGSAVVDYNFIKLDTDEHNRFASGTNLDAPRRFIDSLYFELGANVESDQGFDTKKLASRVFFSPSSRKLAIGSATGDIDSRIQFVWRPSVEFNYGHTFAAGNSRETGKTIVRLVPKFRMTFFTRSLSRILKIANSDFFIDNTFYYLPKDKFKTRHNFFTSGFEVFVIKNFGLGLTYKNGESAPKFRPVNSFGGTLTVRFGRE